MHSVIAIDSADFAFEPAAVAAHIAATWPDSQFIAADPGIEAQVSFGQIQVPAVPDGSQPYVIAMLAREGDVASLDSNSPALVAEFAAVVASLPGFAGSGSAFLIEFADEPVELHFGVASADVLARFNGEVR